MEEGDAEKPNSLLDHLLEGLITAMSASFSIPTRSGRPALMLGESVPLVASEYQASLLTSATGTRLFETILRVAPPDVFQAVWSTYFEGKIGKLAAHPMANFVVARGVSRLDKAGVERVVMECRSVSGGKALISESRLNLMARAVQS